MFKKAVLVLVFVCLAACGGGSDSGGGSETTLPGDMLPAAFVGVYTGVLNLTASAGGFTESDSFPITVTVFANGTVRFDGDDPDETVTVGIDNSGAFQASVNITEDPCTGTISVSGTADGTNVSGTVDGDGTCTQDGLTVDVVLSGDFLASK